jgi:hypothetical protein
MNTVKKTHGMVMTYKCNINRFVKHTNKKNILQHFEQGNKGTWNLGYLIQKYTPCNVVI